MANQSGISGRIAQTLQTRTQRRTGTGSVNPAVKNRSDQLRSHYSRVWRRLQSIPGVNGLGIGMRGWRVYVDSALQQDVAGVPSKIAGFPTETVVRRPSFLCYGNDFQDTLQPGIEIAGKGISGSGSLGCFARLTSDHKTIVLLSAGHVLYENLKSGSGDGNECGQPNVSCCCCCTSHVICRNRGNGQNGYNEVTVEFTHPSLSGITTSDGSEMDCAVAVLNNKRPYTNQSQYYRMIQGTPPSGSLGVSGGDPVEKVGAETGHTKGTICQFNFTSVKYDTGGSGSIPNVLFPIGQENKAPVKFINQFLVVPDPDPNDPSGKTYFALQGDSGSVVVNSGQQVIGLVTAMLPLDAQGIAKISPFLTLPLPPHAGNLGVVSPIGQVLSSLGIEIVNNMQGTVTSSGPVLEVPEEVLLERERVLALERTLQSLEREIRQHALGRTVLDKIQEHRPEAARLVERNRAVIVAWHRCQGPAYAAHCLHSFQDKQYRIPSQVNGVTPWELVQRMAGVLKTYGSERLQNDIRDYEWLAREWIEGCNSVWQLVDRLRKLESVGDMDQDKVEVTADTSVTK
jgi:hypothetical protein